MSSPPIQESHNFSDMVNLFEKQKEALNATKKFKFVLYGGSVGAGKSYLLRWACIYWLLYFAAKMNKDGVRAGLFCEDYPSLNDRHLSKIKTEFPDWLGTYNEQRHEFTLAPEYGSGVLCFRNLDDPSKYLSVEFAIEAVDEVNRNPISMFTLLRTRLRWPGIKDVKFIAACNPVGEAWVKNFWVKRLFPENEREEQEFFFVKALPTDNPHLDPSYFDSLRSLPEAERKAFLEGNWDAFESTMDENGFVPLITDSELERTYSSLGNHAGMCILGVDPAAGGDKSAIVLKSAHSMEVLFNQRLNDTMDLCGLVYELYRKHGCILCVVDKTGLGQGVYDKLKGMGLEVRGINFGEKAKDDTAYKNKKAELFWDLRRWLLSGGKLMRNEAWMELNLIKYKSLNERQVELQPKVQLLKKGLPSPNVADAAALCMAISDTTLKSTRLMRGRPAGAFYDAMDDIMNLPGDSKPFSNI